MDICTSEVQLALFLFMSAQVKLSNLAFFPLKVDFAPKGAAKGLSVVSAAAELARRLRQDGLKHLAVQMFPRLDSRNSSSCFG